MFLDDDVDAPAAANGDSTGLLRVDVDQVAGVLMLEPVTRRGQRPDHVAADGVDIERTWHPRTHEQ